MFWRLCPPLRGWLSVSEYYRIKKTTLDSMANGFQKACGITHGLTPEQMLGLLPDMYFDESKLFADSPESEGVGNALARAALWRDIAFTPKNALISQSTSAGDTMPANTEVNGIWYSSTRGTDAFIGYAVSLYSLLTAINNPKSVLYTRSYADYFQYAKNNDDIKNPYGANCSSYVSWSLGLPYLTVTNWLYRLPCFVNENGEHDTTYGGVCWDSETDTVDTNALRSELKLCDVLDSSIATGGVNGIGHAMIVTGIRRTRDGLIQEVDISEDTFAGSGEPYGCRVTTYTWDDFVQSLIVGTAYRVYRYNNFANTPICPDFSNIVYSDLCTSRGDKIAIRPDQDLALNVIANAGSYAGIVLLKDGTYHSHKEGATDWWLIDPNNKSYPLTTGKYTAILYGEGADPTAMTEANATDTNSTRFIVCAVTVSRTEGANIYTSTYTYTAEAIDNKYPVPVQVSIKKASGFTDFVQMLDESGFNGSGSVTFTMGGSATQAASIIHVPFETEYGFVIAEIGYDNLPLTKPTLPDSGDNTGGESSDKDGPLEYFEYPKGAYIDTGIKIADYADKKVDYRYEGVIDETTSGVGYLFGVLANGCRTGNCYIMASNTLLMYLGGTSSAYKGVTTYTLGNKFVLEGEEICPTNTSTAKVYMDGTPCEYLAGESTGYANADIGETDVTLKVLAGNINSELRAQTKGKFYGFSMNCGGAVCDIIPYRKNGVIGAYDNVTGTFLENQGIGTFVAPTGK